MWLWEKYIQKIRQEAYANGKREGRESGYENGFQNGQKSALFARDKEAEFLWKDREYGYTFNFKPLTDNQIEDIKHIINLEQYASFQELWRNIVFGLYAESRSLPAEQMKIYVTAAKIIREKIEELETYRNRKPEAVPNEPYDV